MRLDPSSNHRPSLLLAAAAFALSGLTACAGPVASVDDQTAAVSTVASEAGTALTLSAQSTGDIVTVQLDYTRPAGADGARTGEIHLRHSKGLRFTGSSTGSALSQSGKNLVVQETDDETLRVVFFATQDLARVDSGTLATLTFEPTGTGPLVVEVLAETPVFAPNDENRGPLFPEPLTISR